MGDTREWTVYVFRGEIVTANQEPDSPEAARERTFVPTVVVPKSECDRRIRGVEERLTSEEAIEPAAMYLAAADREVWERVPDDAKDAYRKMAQATIEAALAAATGEDKDDA
jgi:hypothetical protein